jgi:hypothetical protein
VKVLLFTTPEILTELFWQHKILKPEELSVLGLSSLSQISDDISFFYSIAQLSIPSLELHP